MRQGSDQCSRTTIIANGLEKPLNFQAVSPWKNHRFSKGFRAEKRSLKAASRALKRARTGAGYPCGWAPPGGIFRRRGASVDASPRSVIGGERRPRRAARRRGGLRAGRPARSADALYGRGGLPKRSNPPSSGLLKKPRKGKMPAAYSPSWHVIPPSSVCKQILAPHSV